MDSTPSSHWQDALEPQFVRRVTRPLWQAGITNSQMTNTIFGRSDRIYNRLSLLTQQMQRWGRNSTLQPEQVPIVYAQPAYKAMENSSTQPAPSSQLSSLESITTNSSSSSQASASSVPIVTPNPVSSELGTSKAMPLQAKFEISSARSQRLSTVENTWITNKLPVVPAQSVVSPTSRIATSNAVNDVLKSDKQEHIHSAAIPSTPHTAHSATVADPRSLIVKPSPPQTPTITQETSLPGNPLPVVSAQLVAHSQPMVPLSFSSSTAVGDRKGFSQSIFSTQTVIPSSENEFSRTQETIVSTTGQASQAYSSPFIKTEVSQSTASSQSIDLETVIAKVERRLLRRLVVESERRGQNRWGLRS